MRNTLLILTCILATAVTGGAQNAPDLERLMTRRVVDCNDIVYNCQTLMPRYAQQENTDSLWLVLQYWVNRCGESEQTLRMEMLLNLKDKTFYEANYRNDLLDLLLTYKRTVEYQHANVNNPNNNQDIFYKGSVDFNAFTAAYAEAMAKENDPHTLEYLLCQYYTNNFNPLLSALKRNKIPGTTLQKSYNESAARVVNEPEGNLALIGEWWMPTQGASILGQHPGIGVQLGIKHKKTMVDLTGILRFGKARNEYEVYAQNQVMKTRHFLGGYLGIDVGRELWRNRWWELDLVGGVAYDGFEAIAEDVDAGINSKSINSLNINLGVGLRYYYKGGGQYLSLQPRINAVNYANKAGSDLSGNTVSLRLIWGFSANESRDQQLNQLGFR
jgi:hypothetical protein